MFVLHEWQSCDAQKFWLSVFKTFSYRFWRVVKIESELNQPDFDCSTVVVQTIHLSKAPPESGWSLLTSASLRAWYVYGATAYGGSEGANY